MLTFTELQFHNNGLFDLAATAGLETQSTYILHTEHKKIQSNVQQQKNCSASVSVSTSLSFYYQYCTFQVLFVSYLVLCLLCLLMVIHYCTFFPFCTCHIVYAVVSFYYFVANKMMTMMTTIMIYIIYLFYLFIHDRSTSTIIMASYIVDNSRYVITSQAAPLRCTVVRPMQKSIGKWEIRPPVKS